MEAYLYGLVPTLRKFETRKYAATEEHEQLLRSDRNQGLRKHKLTFSSPIPSINSCNQLWTSSAVGLCAREGLETKVTTPTRNH